MLGVFLAKSFAFFIQFFEIWLHIFGNTSLTFFVEKPMLQRVPKVFLQLMCVLHIAHYRLYIAQLILVGLILHPADAFTAAPATKVNELTKFLWPCSETIITKGWIKDDPIHKVEIFKKENNTLIIFSIAKTLLEVLLCVDHGAKTNHLYHM